MSDEHCGTCKYLAWVGEHACGHPDDPHHIRAWPDVCDLYVGATQKFVGRAMPVARLGRFALEVVLGGDP